MGDAIVWVIAATVLIIVAWNVYEAWTERGNGPPGDG